MSEESSSSPPPKKKVGVEPRSLPERFDEEAGDPFEQLNSDARPKEEPEKERGMIQPWRLPESEEATILEAARLIKLGKSHEEVAKQLRIEPLKLRRWETAYSSEFQKDLNEGDYHDSDAQLRDLADDEKEKFQGNWEQVTEKTTARRTKVGSTRAKLMAHPATKWIFRGEHGDVDYGTVTGILVAVVGLGLALRYMSDARANPESEVDQGGVYVGMEELSAIDHDPGAARDIVIAFHRTNTWEEKLALVIHPDKVKPLMKKWYTKYPEEVHFDRVTFAMDQPMEIGARNFYQIGLIVAKEGDNAANNKNSIMAVERMPDGEYKVEWETSSGSQAMSIEELKAQKPTQPVELRFTLEASNFYNFGFHEDKYAAFAGTFLGNPDPVYLYGNRDDPKARRIASALELRETMGVIVRVRYPENAQADDQLEVVEFVNDSWFRDYSEKK